MKIAFNTANLVGRATDYRFELKNWGRHHALAVETTDARAWNSICDDIARAGYKAVEVWAAHADPKVFTPAKARAWREILDAHELEPVAYAGPLTRQTAEVCSWLGIGIIAGGGHPADLNEARALCRDFNVRYAFENHPEKSVEEILRHVDGGDEWLGVAVDTGWLGTQGHNCPQTIRELGQRISHVHLKDVQRAGAHETLPLGTGCVDVEGCMRALAELGYDGWYSWEDEPEDRNPMEIAGEMRLWIEQRLEK